MKLPNYVKPYPRWVKYIPLLKTYGGNSIYPIILLRQDLYKNLLTNTPSYIALALFHHESFHRKRQIEQGWFKFGIKYMISSPYRFSEEFLAYQESMRWYKKYKQQFPIEKIAKAFAGPQYLWAIPYKKAKEKLEKAWQETKPI